MSSSPGPIKEPAPIHSFFVGTYTSELSEGIYNYLLHSDGSLTQVGLALKTENPSFLALTADKKYLLAVNEKELGTVESFSVNVETLIFNSRQPSGGKNPCFVTINTSGFVLTANYSSGNIGLLKLDDMGHLSDILDIQQHEGGGGSERQGVPHAHSAWFELSGDGVISVDLGTNDLWFSRLDQDKQKLIMSNQLKLDLEPGAGPRHLAFHPDGKWFYSVNELNSSVTLINKTDTGVFEKGPSVSALPVGYTDPNTCSDIHISRDGKFVYVANRGHDSIAVFKASFMDGSLTLLGHKSTGGKGPRNFTLSPDEKYLLIANQQTNNIVVLKRDVKSGLLKYKTQIEAPTPTCIVF